MQYEISEHGQVAGEEHMLAEIFARGPIGCGVAVTKEFLAYSGGIFKDTTGAKVSGVYGARTQTHTHTHTHNLGHIVVL